MKYIVRQFVRKLVPGRLITFCRNYVTVAVLLFRELLRLLTLTNCRRKYSEDPEVLLSQTRTWAHILDKGMQIDTWEVGRSRAAYESLCSRLEKLDGSDLKSDPSCQWAIDKKEEYEKSQIAGHIDHCSGPYIQTAITKDAFIHLIKSRRSIRSFQRRVIEAGIIRELADTMSWSPTSCNRQPAKLYITQSPKKVATCLAQCAGATCLTEGVPCFIAACADSRFYMIQDRDLPFIDVSLGLQNMLLLAHVMGIEATILNWMHHTPKEDFILRETLGIPEYHLIVCNMIIGYPNKITPAPGRKGSDLGFIIVP